MSTSFFKFLVVGGLGFLIDSGLTLSLIKLGFSPLLARPPAILVAMVFTWLANRRYTFKVGNTRSLPEVARYTAIAMVAATLSYLIYSGLVMISLSPFSAIIIATMVVVVFSYFGYKHFAFGISTQTQ